MTASTDYLFTQYRGMFDDLDSHQLAIELLLDDYCQFLNRQKGKRREDCLTDSDVSLETWEKEL